MLSVGPINARLIPNTKSQFTQVLVKFTTTEVELCRELLHSFIDAKTLDIGLNAKTKIVDAHANGTGIVATVLEAKAFAFVTMLYKHMLTTSINATSAKCLTKNQSYKKLHGDIKKGFKVIITGKCKVLVRKSVTPELKARIDKALKAITPKDINDIVVKKPFDGLKTYSFGGSDLAKLYFCIMCAQFEFSVSGNKLTTCESTYAEMKRFLRERGGMIGANVKAFLTQAGAKATKPSANDTDGSKMREKNDMALKALNAMTEVICDMYGITFKPFTMASWEFNADAAKDVKSILE